MPHPLKTGLLLQHKKTPTNIVDLVVNSIAAKSRHSAHIVKFIRGATIRFHLTNRTSFNRACVVARR
jgi:hypothetical protein